MLHAGNNSAKCCTIYSSKSRSSSNCVDARSFAAFSLRCESQSQTRNAPTTATTPTNAPARAPRKPDHCILYCLRQVIGAVTLSPEETYLTPSDLESDGAPPNTATGSDGSAPVSRAGPLRP